MVMVTIHIEAAKRKQKGRETCMAKNRHAQHTIAEHRLTKTRTDTSIDEDNRDIASKKCGSTTEEKVRHTYTAR